jgi:hypothetical protein
MGKISNRFAQKRANVKNVQAVSSPELLNALGLRNMTAQDTETEINAAVMTTALLQETENTYVVLGALQKLNAAFYQTSHRPTAAKLLKEMMRVAEESGASESLTLEWANYQYRRWTTSN